MFGRFILFFNSWWLVPFWNNQWHAYHIWRETRLNREESHWWNTSCNSTKTFYQLPLTSEDAISFLETTCLPYLLGPVAFRRRRTVVECMNSQTMLSCRQQSMSPAECNDRSTNTSELMQTVYGVWKGRIHQTRSCCQARRSLCAGLHCTSSQNEPNCWLLWGASRRTTVRWKLTKDS